MKLLGRRPTTTLEVGCLALTLALVVASSAQSAAQSEEDEQNETEHSDVRENVSVVLDESPLAPLCSSSISVEPDKNSGNPTNMTELVSEVPGVSENGQCGLIQFFSIRGVSRKRVMSLVSGMRINSDRREGVST